jgi:hypothetical protein
MFKRYGAAMLLWLGMLAVVLVIVVRYDAAYEVPTRFVAGTVVGLYKNQKRRVVSPTLLVAQLDDDASSVVVEGTEGLAYKRNARIVMQERRGAILGLRHYAFRRFARSLETPNNDATVR